jgi:hypothetical protein
MFDSSIQGPLGLSPTTLDVRVTMRNDSVVKGQVVKFDITASDGEVTTADVGASNSIFSNVIDATHPPLVGSIHAVCLEAIAENATGMVRVRGIVDALGGDGSTIGGLLTVNADGELEAPATAADLIVGHALQTLANATLGSVLFNGLGYGDLG